MKQLIRSLIVGLLFVVLVACGNKDGLLDSPIKETGFVIGTVVNISVYDEGHEDTVEGAFDLIADWEQILSDEIDSSETSKINQMAGIEPVKVSAPVFHLVEESIRYGDLSDGGFDITTGPLTNLWRIGYDDARKPSQAEIDATLSVVDHEQVELDKENQTVFLPIEGMEIDLGAIAKGFIADEVVKYFDEQGVTTAIIDLGGNVYVKGNRPSGEAWTVGVQNPYLGRGQLLGRIRASDLSVVTSGIYERYLEVDGETYHHILDPDTGYPFENEIAGVTIASETSLAGDALSTAVFSLGLEDGLALIEDLPDVEAVFVTKDRRIVLSSGLTDTFEVLNDNFETVK
ncbi:FAD:protein FMN transferase [Halolactibacillus alkaliphilus]|uniref:FAD:protein FMN transferase n=2 Tax=Halolactibacillus alkaliphilus TaxID=442899 RepID=A0A511X4K0_9BACI|nr:FAD:protein FMN transferase [Halolactibacillus alkaliphilus]GGN75585.1 FAD:protein FMN transferase [Halolactibacillus alkaliphilus]SFP06839.1 thiamine biosynthesis lipoprotein [Halolactibacillus alkaliphilus]